VTYTPTSCILYHGPGAESVGHAAALAFGRLLPFTGSSLKKEGARELVALLSQRAVGGGRSSVLVGPVDEVNPATSDVLLKTIEEFDPEGTRPFLWAWDLGGVSLTLRSRCILQFCPGVDARTEGYDTVAESLLAAYHEGDWVTVVEMLKEAESSDLLLRAVVDALAPKLSRPDPDVKHTSLWESLRPLFSGSPLTPARMVAAFLVADHRAAS
jgi:hypothetical protein